MNQGDIRIVEKEFKNKRREFILWFGFQEKFYENFLKIQLGFLAFIGIIFTIIFSDTSEFSCYFLVPFLFIVFITFLLFVVSLLMKSRDIDKTLKKQYRRLILSKVCHIAAIDGLEEYRKEANNLLIKEDQIRQEMQKGKSIEEIIKYKENNGWIKELFVRIELLIWVIIFLSVPILFLLEFTGIFQ